ncbi:ankyrin repeat domain-containing protein [Anatilimnocola floriformis]|uniref:ankyrin repeat domain-containing protein n=1 Tax=Anatilimnocola floriformis TaxID=2948575 RepID=UPI0020C41FB2|nr:hypothetical protein [Anatilimnocola floriformis]
MNRISIVMILFMLAACAPRNEIQEPATREPIHQKYCWTAEDSFTDRKVIRLCRAIESNDIAQIERLVAEGADVNSLGKGGMTPLMWSFPGNKLDRFRRLLELGADPNVFFESDFNTKGNGFMPGQSVTELAAATRFPGYFSCVMNHGGNPKLVNPVSKHGLLIVMIHAGVPDCVERTQLFADKGGDVNQKSSDGCPAVMEAAKFFAQFNVANRLLDLGADPRAYWDDQNKKLSYIVVRYRMDEHVITDQAKSDLYDLEQRLTKIGESLEEARADKLRWRSWDWPSGEGLRKLNAERAERHAQEAVTQGRRNSD